MVTKELENKIMEAYGKGANDREVCIETGIKYDDLLSWLTLNDNKLIADNLRLLPIWEAKKTIAEKAKSDEKTAQWLLSHHKESKADWSDRTELTGKDGKDLPITLVKFIDKP